MTLKENCKDRVFQYLSNQNRPYSANDVMQNLHKEFGKTAIQKSLDDLTLEGKIREKTYGKQKVYSLMQNGDCSEENISLELVTLDSKIEEISEKLKTAEQKLKQAEEAVKEMEKEPLTENAFRERDQLKTELKDLEKKIENLSKNVFELSEKDKKEISKNHENFAKEHRKRKRICMDVINSVMESYPKKLKVLIEEIGIELDENT